MKIRLKYEESHKFIEKVLYKLCNRCRNWFPCTSDYFYKTNCNSKDGLYPYCKECSKKKAIEWQHSNYDRWRELVAIRDAKPRRRDIIRESSRKQKERGYFKKYQKLNAEKMRKYSAKRNQNKYHSIKNKEWEKCKEYFENCCAYCGISENEAKATQGQFFHKEHVNHEGLNDLSNCVPSCRSCNCKKWKFKLEEWYNEENTIFDKERLKKIFKWINEDHKQYMIK
ncbi:MAG: HNH endonuclease [Veillonella parvula]|uniref:HNH endonuclease n=1 Tax=Veillonella parvula TaxID=29466 RepID=A0A943A3S2_VEIPA|nr:HNH endonuclease [Veillonella parvula]MBS4893815.1 HNH endonuclease [Veillonella parvula]